MSRLSSLAAKLAETLADGGWRAKARRERRNFPVPMRWPHAGSDPGIRHITGRPTAADPLVQPALGVQIRKSALEGFVILPALRHGKSTSTG
jgi:hypothetical protein